MSSTGYRIGEISALTGVKAGTIRFYEWCGFLEKAERLPNRYRVFNRHHIYQIRVCRLVFGGFVNKHLRRISMSVIEAASRWDLSAYEEATQRYKKAIEDDIVRTENVILIAMNRMGHDSDLPADKFYTKKQAAEMLGVTPETVRNWERNGLIYGGPPYQRRFYGEADLNRMYVIRFLLDTGYSIMAILRFLTEYEAGEEQKAMQLLFGTEAGEDLKYRADRYLDTLQQLRKKANALYELLEEMKKI